MLLVRILLGLLLGYALLVFLAWVFQERIAFPAPRASVPDPRQVGAANGERIELALRDGTKLAGWYLRPRSPPGSRPPWPALLWFYGNGENIASIGPIVRDFQPPGAALLVVDYPGYGGSGGRATEASMYEAADAAYAAVARRPDVDRARIYGYGRSLGSAVASHVAARHAVAGLVLQSPFTNALDIAREHYALFPRFIVRLRLDNLANLRQVPCPGLVFHGTPHPLAPPSLGRPGGPPAPGAAPVGPIQGAGRHDTQDLSGADA